MASRFVFEGLEQLKADLQNLPAALAGDGADIVERHATQAFDTIEAGYPSRAGALKDKLTVTHTRSAFGARSVVKNTAKEASWFEHGTQARHNALGANRGSMPPNPIFTQTIIRERRGMYDDLKGLLEQQGLTVTGDA
jgi:hypothetical protein